jgi:hypothetical protein
MRQIPDELNEFELATFFTFSRKELIFTHISVRRCL